ncbi:hypothetical protein EJ08DRAFT_590706 [Tothia fuscella]|uniref:Zn(2)-C6 fungal-type domain-containing protein n=1 Tax=Tothia fuscella TaxID=1048955 RepID=A0A9P4NQF7_9PEZI|nr:hypothetical protein EJ08DRAFT_590706 [Tothia fuscella]
MPPRLAHKKSRTGCQRCKARRVKCDETHPICNNCKRHGVSCEFPVTPPKSRRGSAALIEPIPIKTQTVDWQGRRDSHTPILMPMPLTCSSSKQRAHHFNSFTTIVSHSFPSPINSATVDIIQLGLQYEFLMNAIFALTALHIIRNVPESPLHRFYLNLALQQQREGVAGFCSANATPLVLSSVLISYQGLNLQPDHDYPKMYTPPCQWLHMTNGISKIASMAMSMMDEQRLNQFQEATTYEIDFRDRAAMFNPANSKIFEALLNWSKYPEPDLDMTGRAIYEKTLDYIGGVHQALVRKEPPRHIFRRILCFGPLVPAQFTTFLEQGRPRALAILAHHCALASAVDDHWVFQGLARREVLGIQSILPAEWQWAMEWPLAMLGQGLGSVP